VVAPAANNANASAPASTGNNAPTPAPAPAPQGVTGQEGQRNAAVRASDAVKPEDMPGLAASLFAVPRINDDKARYAHLLTLHATTAGLIRTLGGNDFLANPTDDNARRYAKLTSLPASNANKPAGKATGKK
jgi:hypothetical protein